MEKNSVCSLAMDPFVFQPGFPLKYFWLFQKDTNEMKARKKFLALQVE
jgi:hypothetical protein